MGWVLVNVYAGRLSGLEYKYVCSFKLVASDATKICSYSKSFSTHLFMDRPSNLFPFG